jgi:hypothetical protein
MTRTLPWRRITLQCSQIGLTLGWTFIGASGFVIDRPLYDADGYL